MKKILLPVLLIAIFSCKKKEDQPAATPDPCLHNNLYTLQASVGGASWCAGTVLFADLAIDMTMHGENSNGSTLTLELDSLHPGTYLMTHDYNHVLYTSPLADAFESTNSNPGTLIITSNDTAANLLRGTFNITVQSPLTGNLTISGGNFVVYYTE